MSVVDGAWEADGGTDGRRQSVARSVGGSVASAAGAAAAGAGFSLEFVRSFSYLYDFVASVRPYLSSCCCRLLRGLRQQRRQTGKMFGKVSAALLSVRKSDSFCPMMIRVGTGKRGGERERACKLGGNNTASRLARGHMGGWPEAKRPPRISIFFCRYYYEKTKYRSLFLCACPL